MKEKVKEIDRVKDAKQGVMITSKVAEPKKTEFILDADRTIVDFSGEIESMLKHEEIFTKPRLRFLVNNIYIPKYKVKCFSSYIYGGENS